MAQPEQALVVTQRNGTGFITLLTALLRNREIIREKAVHF
jgi:hypothetical protein